MSDCSILRMEDRSRRAACGGEGREIRQSTLHAPEIHQSTLHASEIHQSMYASEIHQSMYASERAGGLGGEGGRSIRAHKLRRT